LTNVIIHLNLIEEPEVGRCYIKTHQLISCIFEWLLSNDALEVEYFNFHLLWL
jgi:hypothetical protein